MSLSNVNNNCIKLGPNKAADPIVSRWKRHDGSNEIVKNSLTNLPILQFVGIERRDTGDWAIPGVRKQLDFIVDFN